MMNKREQTKFTSKIWGELTFYPSNDSDDKRCRRCLLNTYSCRFECEKAKCLKTERDDKQNGYYSIHQMPEYRHKELSIPFAFE